MTPSQPDSAAPQFEFAAFALNKVLFEHIPRVKPGKDETEPTAVNSNITIGAAIRLIGDRRAEVSMGMTVVPDPKWKPYKIELEVLGRFQASNGTREQFLQFCQLAVPPILFPYMREIVHRLTADGKHGPLRLNPINVQSMLNQTEWQTVSDQATKEPADPPSDVTT
jgi:preprotein translocase subunit SecB